MGLCSPVQWLLECIDCTEHCCTAEKSCIVAIFALIKDWQDELPSEFMIIVFIMSVRYR